MRLRLEATVLLVCYLISAGVVAVASVRALF